MKRAASALGFLVVLALVAGASAPVLAESPCERADAIRKHVAASDKMPAEVKADLLKKATQLCPKSELVDVIKKGDELLAQGKLKESLEEFQLALASEDKKVCQRCFEIAGKLKKDGNVSFARSFFEAGLSVCYDAKAYKDYQALPQAVASNLEAKGSERPDVGLIKKETIVESLLAKPARKTDQEDVSIEPQRRQRDSRYDNDRRERPYRSDRYDRYYRFANYDRHRWEDDEDTGVQSFPVQFESGSATLTTRGKRQLDELAMAMESKELGRVRHFFIDGHTDSIGTPESNCDLAYKRAESVKHYLTDKWNINPKRLVPRAFGQNRPIAPNYDENGRFDNRRVEIRNADMAREDSRYSRGRCD